MTLLIPSLFLGGIVAAVIPILLHLIMRTKPKRVELPTLRFVRERLVQNRRRFVLRHFWLLAARILFLILLGLLLARPSWTRWSSGGRFIAGPGTENVPTAVVLAFDTSVRMDYLYNNETRMERACSMGRQILSELTRDSQAAILNASGDNDSFQVDLQAAGEKIDHLSAQAGGRTIGETVLQGIRLLSESKLPRRELFILTDSTRPGWSERFGREIQRELQRVRKAATRPGEEISIYLLDVGQKEFENTYIADLGLSSETVTSGVPIRLDVVLGREGTPLTVTADLILHSPPDAQGKRTEKKIASTSVAFPSGRSRRTARFQLPELPPGLSQGCVRLVAGDALNTDNVRWFTVDVRQGQKLLLVGRTPVRESTLFLQEALAPFELRKSGLAPFETEAISDKELEKKTVADLSSYNGIMISDPGPLSAALIKTLTEYVRNGGGLAIFLGPSAIPVNAFQTSEAVELLGGKPESQVRVPDWNVSVRPVDASHSILAGFRLLGTGAGVPWHEFTVGRYWYLTDLANNAAVAAIYTDGRPAFYSRSLGLGTVVVGTSPLGDTPDRADRSVWNRWTAGDSSWIFLVLADGIAKTLVSGGSSVFNYYPGETVIDRPAIKVMPATVTVTEPDGKQISVSSDPALRQIRFAGTTATGLYLLRSPDDSQEEKIESGFAVNPHEREFDLNRVPDDEMKSFWKDSDFHIIRELKDIQRKRVELQAGSELFSLLAVALGLLLVCEYILGNKFYKN